VDELKAKADKATGEEKTKAGGEVKDAVAKRDAAKKKLEELEKPRPTSGMAVEKERRPAFDERRRRSRSNPSAVLHEPKRERGIWSTPRSRFGLCCNCGFAGLVGVR